LSHYESATPKFQIQGFVDVALAFFDDVFANNPHIRSTVLDIGRNVNRPQDQKACPLLGILEDKTPAFAEPGRTTVNFLEEHHRLAKQSSLGQRNGES
jgi:hypothetical protein